MEHNFNVDIATEYGVNEAIIIHNLAFWIKRNKANDNNYINGRYWTYNSVKAFTELFPYWSSDQIRRTLQRLIREKVIISANHNTNKYNQTKWYSITAKSILRMYKIDLAESQNEIGESQKSITDSNTDTKHSSSFSVSEKEAKSKKEGYTYENGIEVWNRLVLWNNKKVPIERIRNKDSISSRGLLTKCTGVTESLRIEWNKKKINEEAWKLAINKYIGEIVNRDPTNDYCNHRFSMFEFVKQKNGYLKFVNK